MVNTRKTKLNIFGGDTMGGVRCGMAELEGMHSLGWRG